MKPKSPTPRHSRSRCTSTWVATLSLCSALFATSATLEATPQFKDVTRELGLTHLQNHHNRGAHFEAEVMTGGAVAGDFDGDGWVDLFVTAFDNNAKLFLNLGVDPSGKHLGFVDIAPTAFSPAPPGRLSNGAAAADVDGDGDLDIYITSVLRKRYDLWINDGQGNFTEEAILRGASLQTSKRHKGFSTSFGDYDRDGFLDMYVSEWGQFSLPGNPNVSNSRLLRNLGPAQPGHYEDVNEASGVSIEGSLATGSSANFTGVFAFTPRFADLDNDGWPDLTIAGDFNTSRLFWNNGDGTFTDGTQAASVIDDENGMGATIGDFNRDGNLDWFVTSIYDSAPNCGVGCNWGVSGNRLYLGRGGRQLVDGTSASGVRDGGWGWAPVAFDYNNDGRLDLAMTNGIVFASSSAEDAYNTDPMKLWKNTSEGFVEISAQMGLTDTGSGKGMLSLDYDRDGDLDLFLVNNEDNPILYRNERGNKNSWLQITLKAHGGNVFGIGARIRVWPKLADAPIVHEMSASSNYLAQDECLAHFGLGTVKRVDKIEVRWPDGTATEWFDVDAKQRVELTQP